MSRTELFLACVKELLPSRMKGKAIMWWMTFNLVVLWWVSTLFKLTIDTVVGITYSAAVAAYVGGRQHEMYEQRMQGITTKKMEDGDV